MQKVKEEHDKSGVKWVTSLEVEALRTGAKASRNPIRNVNDQYTPSNNVKQQALS